MQLYKVFVTLHPPKTDPGRGIRTIQTSFDAESEEEASDFAKQYFEGFLKESIEVTTKVFS